MDKSGVGLGQCESFRLGIPKAGSAAPPCNNRSCHYTSHVREKIEIPVDKESLADWAEGRGRYVSRQAWEEFLEVPAQDTGENRKAEKVGCSVSIKVSIEVIPL